MSGQATGSDECQGALTLDDGHARLHRLLGELPAGAYTCDRDGLITYFNQRARELWGRAPKLNDRAERFCGSFRLYAVDGSAIPHDQCWMALALTTGLEYNGHEIVIERPDGQRRIALAHANPIRDESGKIVGAVNVLVDITARTQAEGVLKMAERSKNEFLATLAHELRNPLAPIRSAVQILHLKGSLGPESQWALSVIDRQVLHMARLIDDLVDIARITSNRLELRRERVELASVLRVAVETTAALLEASGQHFALTVPAEPIHLDADPTRLAQAIANLLNNAAKYTPHGGHIWLTGERRGEQAVVTVRDDGIGIPASMLSRVFEMFTQGEQSQARAHGGLGIGLTLVKRLAELHGGTVSAHSEGPDKGSAFVISLPLPAESQSREPKTRNDAMPSAASSLRILVVDDNQDAADSLAILLQNYGNETRIAYDGLQALEVAEEFRPDVVLLDIGLPKADGHEVARRLRHEPWGADICVIAVTGWSNETDRARTRDAGFDHHLVKPLDPAELTRLLVPLEDAARSRGKR